MPHVLILLLFFLSGMTGLIYEVFWLKELGLLFGNAAYAMATTLAAFFAGLAAGGYFWGKRVARSVNALKLYAGLEAGIALCALAYFGILKAYGLIYPQLYDVFGNQRLIFILVKFLLAGVLLFPAAWFMGGTLPVISHFVVQNRDQMGAQVSVLYAVNTLGAVLGVLLAAFYLPAAWGYQNGYALAITTTLTVAACSWFYSFKYKPIIESESNRSMTGSISSYPLWLAFVSGFLMLALQVIWNRMFAQVLQNSVYTFALLLMVFLLCLSGGGFLAGILMALKRDPVKQVFWLLVLGAVWVGISPYSFLAITDGLHYVSNDQGWTAYLGQVFITALVVIGPPVLLLGTILPMLVKINENQQVTTGEVVGKLLSLNTLGSIFGSIAAGFIMLDSLGMWSGIRLLAVVYGLCAWLWLDLNALQPKRLVIMPVLVVIAMVSILDTNRLPLVAVDPVVEKESLLQVWEGSSGTVAVVRQQDELKLKVNNYYTLGGTGSMQWEQLQGYLPLLLHENPQSVYLLGMGTGITAGGSLLLPIQSLTMTELIPEVVLASEKYFGDYTNGLFYDPRVEIIAEDGRNYLRGSRKQFDVIISDLFVPWKAGTGSLYTLEHFNQIKRRLNKKGLFMQWLPSYQLSVAEFNVIAKTMLEVFPQVTVWRGDFGVLKPVIGLLGQMTPGVLSKKSWLFTQPRPDQGDVSLLSLYMGELSALKAQLNGIEINRDDRPLIEMRAPINQLQNKVGVTSWLAGESLVSLMQRLMTQEWMGYLKELDSAEQDQALAGYYLHYAQVLKYQGLLAQMKIEMNRYHQLLGSSINSE